MAIIYGLIDPREPDHIRYVGTISKMDKAKCLDSLGSNVLNKDRRWWIMNLEAVGLEPIIVEIEKVKEDLYYHTRAVIRDLRQNGHELFNSKYWVMEKKMNKLERVKIMIALKKLRKLFPEANFVGMWNGWNWHIMCDDFEFYMHNKKFKIWKGLTRKKLKFYTVFCYSSKAKEDVEYLQTKFKEDKFL